MYLVDAYVRLGCAQADCLQQQQQQSTSEAPPTTASDAALISSSSPSPVSLADLDATVAELQKWVDLTDSKVCAHN